MDYKTSGVDIEAGRSFVNEIKESVKSTHRPEVLGGFGGFNGMMRIPSEYKNPVLVSGTDGVGTKLNVAKLANDHHGIGIDLVAMCVNDVITSGAEPLFFLDYIACGKIQSNILKQVVEGIVEGCKISNCSLLGGETAEMPKFYESDKYDLAGFCVGVVEEEKKIDGKKIQSGDKIIGIESSGFHSNGYSLLNDMLSKHKLFFKDVPELITPTQIYSFVVNDLMKNSSTINGMAHITGGGLPENISRIIPRGLGAKIDYDSWPLPRIFYKIMMAGEIPPEEMKNVFNLGIGYCIVTSPDGEENIHMIVNRNGLNSWTIGEVVL
tara:strand:+ start:154 stop:1122 length:969 start_codon:yes stop_codon:yes gene_type:complete